MKSIQILILKFTSFATFMHPVKLPWHFAVFNKYISRHFLVVLTQLENIRNKTDKINNIRAHHNTFSCVAVSQNCRSQKFRLLNDHLFYHKKVCGDF